jgi:class 3 adenylate cyclase/tetratricopeptide (TPR) repeat protein
MGTEAVTVLFTDVVGSTESLSRIGEAAAEELRREVFELSRVAVSDRGGRVVKNVGDGLMVVFGAPSAALDAAVSLQQAVELRNRKAEEHVHVRVGVSMGECDVDNGDYFGRPVVEAARLCASADGDQILVTDVVRLLAGGRVAHVSESLGALALKGLDQAVAACLVRWAPATPEVGGVPVPTRLVRADGAVFVGRDAERSALLEALKDTTATGRRRVSFVSGEPGIGKTTLLCEVAARAAASGATVLYGRCEEDLAAPFQPWREVLAYLAQHAPGVVEPHEAVLAPLLGGDAVRASADPESERYLLYATLVELFSRVSAEAPVVVVLDDLHWADGPTVALIRHLAAANATLRVLIVGTFRDADLGSDHPLTHALAAFHREDGVERLVLRGLGDLEVLAFLEALAGHEMDAAGVELRDALLAETDGNPFFLGEMLRHLSETGTIHQDDTGRWVASADLREHGLPVSVREVVARRVARLGDETRRALGYASVIGRDFDLDLLADVLDRDPDDVLDLVEPAIEHAVVTDVAPGRFSFAHALVEHTLYDELSPTRRARAHALVASALEARLGAEPGARTAELAYHWGLATTPQDATKAIDYAIRAGDFALAQLAPAEARRWYTRALELIDQSRHGDDRTRATALVGLGDARRRLGEPDYLTVLAEASRLAVTLADTDLLVRAALATNRGIFTQAGVIATDTVRLLRAAVAATAAETTPRRAKLLASLATEVLYEDPREAIVLANEAVDLARRLGDDATLCWVSVRADTARHVPETQPNRLRDTAETLEAAERLGNPALLCLSLTVRYWCLLESGVAADDFLLQAEELAERVGDPYLRWVATFYRATHEAVRGHPQRSESFATRALEIGLESNQPDAFTFYGAQLLIVRQLQGREDEIVDLVADAAAQNPGLPVFRLILAWLYATLGRSDDALDALAPDIADGFSSFPWDTTWTTSLSVAAQTVTLLRLAEPARQLYTLIDPVPTTAILAYEVFHHSLGGLATVLGRYEDADEHFRAAHDIHERMGASYFLARTRLAWAEMLVQRDRADDLDRAQGLASAAMTTAAEDGYSRIERNAKALLDHRA